MEKKRILIVSHELDPYLVLTEAAALITKLMSKAAPANYEIRAMMPRFSEINERRHRLHEVVRLSGINITIGKDDNPLLIKVASLMPSRIQCYFMDNDDYFKRPSAFIDGKSKKFYEDNDERMIFYNKAVIETVRKFGWSPHIVHCHGWFSSLIPCYLKTAYKNDPVFSSTKIVQSLYTNVFKEKLSDKFLEKALVHNLLKTKDLEPYKGADNAGVYLGAMKYSDALILGSEYIDPTVEMAFAAFKGPKLGVVAEEDMYTNYFDFYKTLLD